MSVLVTGATGFVGSALCRSLCEKKFSVVAAVRQATSPFSSCANQVVVGNIDASTDWSTALDKVDVVVHLAGRSDLLRETATDPRSEFFKVNVDGTVNLARQAAEAGVKRFVFISTIKVNGELTELGRPFREDDAPDPQGLYAVSKWQAEQELAEVATAMGLEVVIIRPPLVYGPESTGNFQRLVHSVSRGIPLPLGAVYNRRSLVGLDNLIDFITVCIDHPAAAKQTFFVSDGEDLSTPQLIDGVGTALGKQARLLSVPVRLLDAVAALFGKQTVAQRLLGHLQVDTGKATRELGWKAPFTVDDGLREAVAGQKAVGFNHIAIIRLLDLCISAFGLIAGAPLMALLVIIGLFDTGSPIFRQKRVGKDMVPFVLVKFRTMKLETASVATHFASASSITRFGNFMRRTKLDELPQLWNVLKGEMSLVGPRPCLFNQEELLRERKMRGVFSARPGITGLAQINKIDMSRPQLLAETDASMLANLTIRKYFYYIFQTVLGRGSGDCVGRGN